jgi:23S rRNA pseudouridine2457 synthase
MLYAFHKPFGVLSQFTTPTVPGLSGICRPGTAATQAIPIGGTTLADFIDIPEIYPAGRLDQNSEGLLLLTDDGRLQQRISDPRAGSIKVYQVQLEGMPTHDWDQQIVSGTRLKDGAAHALWATPLGAAPRHGPHPGNLPAHRQANSVWFEIALRSGRNRIVRRLCAALGHPVLRLVRTRIGSIDLGELTPGSLRAETGGFLAR